MPTTPLRETERFVELTCDIATESRWCARDLLSFIRAHASDCMGDAQASHLYRWCQLDDTTGLASALISLLQAKGNLTQKQSGKSLSPTTSRYTDWSKSAPYRSGNLYLKYYNKPKVSLPHNEIGRFLIAMAEDLANLLRLFEDAHEKRPALEDAIAEARRHFRLGQAITPPQGQRRKHILEQLELLWGSDRIAPLRVFEKVSVHLFGTTKEASRKFAKKVSEGLSASNPNTLLEVIATLSIVKAAKGQSYETIEDLRNNKGQLAGITLERDECPQKIVIAKKKPAFLSNQNDEQFIQIMKAMGDRATGLEPDTCLEFYKERSSDLPAKVHLADAKRNSGPQPEKYRASAVKSALSYLLSYESHRGSLTSPEFTLFFLNAGKKVAGKTRKEFCESGFPDQPPSVIGLGFKNGDMEGDLPKKWFGELLSQVEAE